jgi:adenylate kinase
MLESLVLNASRENFSAYVVAPGILYGGGEDDLATAFRDAWMCEQSLTIIGEGTNILPTLHVDDLVMLLERFALAPPSVDSKPYIVLQDFSNKTQVREGSLRMAEK